MEKPAGYDEAQAFGEFETLPAGGYKCLIKQVKCEKTQNGKEFLKLAIDILEGEYKDFYKRKFDNDTRDDKKWSGTWTIFTEGYNPGTTNPKFKGLITSVESSNVGFKFDFTKEQELVNKKVGIVFREEEFEGFDGQVHTSVKPFFAISYDKAEEANIPAPKKLAQKGEAFDNFTTTASDNDDLPF